MKWLSLCVVLACHDETPATSVTIPTASTTSSAAASTTAPAAASSSAAPVTPEIPVVLGAATHFKSGARGRAGDVSFTVRLLPKLIVSGPQPEIEQAQLEVSRGPDHATLQVDTRNKRAEWSGLVFELGYADVYHDDIELTVRKK